MITFFARHPTVANLLMLIFCLMGLFSLPSIRRETFPDFASEQVQIQAVYPGASAEEVEEAVCQRIEEAVDGVNYVEEVRSEAQESLARVTVQMQEGGDLSTFIDDLERRVEAITTFPENVEDPVVTELNREDQVVSLMVTGPMSPRDLKAYCEELKDRLQREAGISLVAIKGFSDHQIRIQVPASTLMQYRLSLADIAATISRQSVDMPAGSIETADQEVLIRFTDQRRTPEEFEDLIVVSGSTGAEIRLGEIAEIRDVFEKDEEKILLNGRRAAVLQITKTKMEDTLDTYDALTAFLDKEKIRQPPRVEFSLSQDMSSNVRDRLDLLIKNGWQGLLLVFVTLWLFFDVRLAFWVAMGLPVSFLGALFFFPQLNYSLNMMTMVALLIALGLLMDDAIVITENIVTNLRRGKTPFRAVVDGTTEVQNGVISSFLTTICVFGPLAFLTGNMGKVLRVVPVVLILVLVVSLVEAFMILPRHLAHSLRPESFSDEKRSRLRRRFDAAIEWVREHLVGRVADIAVSHRYLTLGLVLGVFILSVATLGAGILKFVAFPDTDGDYIETRILMPQGTPLEHTEAVVEQLTGALEKVNSEFTPLQPDGQDLVRTVTVQYNQNSSAGEQGPHVATVVADLLSAEIRTGRIDDYLAWWRDLAGIVPDAVSIIYTQSSTRVAGQPIELKLKGDDLDQLKAAARDLQVWFGQFKGVHNLSDDLRSGKPEVKIRLRETASILGVTGQMIASQLRTAYYGTTVTDIQVGPESYEIYVRLDHRDRDSLDDLDDFHITLAGGKQVPIKVVALFETGRGYSSIPRLDGQRTVTVQGDIDTATANASELLSKFKKEYLAEFVQRFKGVTVLVEGQSKETAKTGFSMARAFMIGVVGIFVLLSFQFRSYLEPFVVMVAIPLSLIGAIWGHIFMGLDFCMPSMIGFFSLAGIVVNDSILLVEFIKLRRREGMSIAAAACQASRQRFRAVLLTSVTTIAGLLPLLSEKSRQAQSLIPLSASIVFGLMASTILVLLVVPALYTILGDLGIAAKIEVGAEQQEG